MSPFSRKKVYGDESLTSNSTAIAYALTSLLLNTYSGSQGNRCGGYRGRHGGRLPVCRVRSHTNYHPERQEGCQHLSTPSGQWLYLLCIFVPHPGTTPTHCPAYRINPTHSAISDRLVVFDRCCSLNASRLILRHSNTLDGSSHRLQPNGLPWTPQSLVGSI
jgi:hypothetical protein